MEKADLSSLTRRQLVNLARKAGIPPQYRLTKTQIITALQAAESMRAEPREPAELPQSYGRTRLTLLEVEPLWIYAYWEVTTPDCAAAVEQADGGGQWVLRFYDVTAVERGAAGVKFFDVFVDLGAGNWYVNLWSGGKSYFAELGLLSPAGRLVSVCRSNTSQVPPSNAVPEPEPDMASAANVPDRSGEATADAAGAPAPDTDAVGPGAGTDRTAELRAQSGTPGRVPTAGRAAQSVPPPVPEPETHSGSSGAGANDPDTAVGRPASPAQAAPSSHTAGSFGLGRSFSPGEPPTPSNRRAGRSRAPRD